MASARHRVQAPTRLPKAQTLAAMDHLDKKIPPRVEARIDDRVATPVTGQSLRLDFPPVDGEVANNEHGRGRDARSPGEYRSRVRTSPAGSRSPETGSGPRS
jgi:hypothetical protein